VTEELFSRDRYELPGGALRRLTAADAAALGASLTSMDPWRTLGYQAAGLAAYLQRPDPALARFVAVVDGAVAGAIAVRFPWLRGPQLELFAVLDAFQRRGLAAAMMTWLENESFRGAPNLWTCVSSFNDRARRFYKSRGFAEVATIPDLVRAGFDEILLRKQRP
jgi:ribosomal protein S18 acetylase RimI-like enzyme